MSEKEEELEELRKLYLNKRGRSQKDDAKRQKNIKDKKISQKK